MIYIDPFRCAYCRGCVSVCPVKALTLVETRLEVSEACIEWATVCRLARWGP